MATTFSATITLYPIITGNSPITLNLEEKQLVDFSFTNSDRNDYYLPSWGVCSNGGSLTFKDDSGDILAYSMQGYLQKKATLELKINTATFTYYITSWNYNELTKEAVVDFNDLLEELQKISVQPITYREEYKTKSFLEIYSILLELTPTKYEFLQANELDKTTNEYLSKSYNSFWFLNEKTLWSAWNSFCEATNCHIYYDGTNTICKYLEGD